METVGNINKIFLLKKLIVETISKNKIENIDKIHDILFEDSSNKIVQIAKNDLLVIHVMVVRNNADTYTKISEETKIKLLRIVSLTLTHNKLEELLLFLNLFGSLLQEIYDLETCKLKNVSEEHISEVLNSVQALFNSCTYQLCYMLYNKRNGMRICKIIFIIGEILKSKCRKLKVEALKCLMAVFRVEPESNIQELFMDLEILECVADCFSYFLPGIALFLGSVVLEGERIGQNVLQLTIDAMGKVMSILLKDYEQELDILEDAKAIVKSRLRTMSEQEEPKPTDKREDFLRMKRSAEWFSTSDKHLAQIFSNFKYLTHHQSVRVRSKLAEMCCSLITHCFKNLSQSSYPLIEILIILSDDENEEISSTCKAMLNLPILDQRVMSILSDRFYQNYSKIPTVFNGIDTKEQINILKLTTASIKIVGNRIKCNDSFFEFQRMLLYLCEIQIDISTFDEVISLEDLNNHQPISIDLWKNFKFMREEKVRNQFAEMCKVIYEADLFPILSDYLVNVITFEEEKVEAFYLMNRLLEGVNKAKSNSDKSLFDLIFPIFQTYINNWNVTLQLDEDDCPSLRALRNNVLQAGLMCEGVGLMVFHAKENDQHRPFLFGCLYKVLIRAASSHHQVQAAAANTLRNMATGLGYQSVTHLLNGNMDFFLFNIEKGLRTNSYNIEVFDVMEMVMRYGDSSILHHFSDFVHDILVQSFDKFKQNRIDHYLRIFRIFLKSLMRWFDVSIPQRILKTKAQKREDELANFKVGGLDDEKEITDFSDELMEKSAEEMYKEDMEKKRTELEKEYVEPQVESYEKPKPPLHIKITVEILKRSLNFLPSKDPDRKLTVLEILKNGVEILKDYEDELLPVVHLLWSPLVDRFKDIDSPIILNYSFQLLVVLGRVSKDFIRNRTTKDVLPDILSILSTFTKRSYMKDKGSAYRYSLDYKLQLLMLENIAYLVTDIELLDKDVETTMSTVFLYLNDTQPKPLQAEAIKFFQLIAQYEPLYLEKIKELSSNSEFERKIRFIFENETHEV